MDPLFSKIQKRLTQKSMDFMSVGALLVQKCKKYAKKPELISGKILHNTFTLYLGDSEDQAHRFMNRAKIISELNKLLKDNNYSIYIKKIRFLRKETVIDNQEY